MRLCGVNERLIAAPVPAFPAYLPAADGVISEEVWCSRFRQPPLRFPCTQRVNGCCSLGAIRRFLWSRKCLTLRNRNDRCPLFKPPCSRIAETGMSAWLAGSHLLDSASGDYNVPVINRLFLGATSG